MLLRDCDFQVFRIHYTTDIGHREGIDGDIVRWERGVKQSCLVVAPNATIARAMVESTTNSWIINSIQSEGEVFMMMRG